LWVLALLGGGYYAYSDYQASGSMSGRTYYEACWERVQKGPNAPPSTPYQAAQWKQCDAVAQRTVFVKGLIFAGMPKDDKDVDGLDTEHIPTAAASSVASTAAYDGLSCGMRSGFRSVEWYVVGRDLLRPDVSTRRSFRNRPVEFAGIRDARQRRDRLLRIGRPCRHWRRRQAVRVRPRRPIWRGLSNRLHRPRRGR
jgi:hypothetical protein